MSFKFYAARQDVLDVLDHILSLPDVRLFEMYSPYDTGIREIKAVKDFGGYYPAFQAEGGLQKEVFLSLWLTRIAPANPIERIELDPDRCNGATFRYCVNGGGTVNLYLGGRDQSALSRTLVSWNSQARAVKWGIDAGIDWTLHRKWTNKLKYHITKRMAADWFHDSWAGGAVLPAAAALWKEEGYRLHCGSK